jgi:hypothetical protein
LVKEEEKKFREKMDAIQALFLFSSLGASPSAPKAYKKIPIHGCSSSKESIGQGILSEYLMQNKERFCCVTRWMLLKKHLMQRLVKIHH